MDNRFSFNSSGSTLKMSNKHTTMSGGRGGTSSSGGAGKGGKGSVGFTSYFRKKKQKSSSNQHNHIHRRSLSKKQLEKERIAQEKLREVLAPVEFSQEEEDRLKELKQYKRWKRMQQERYKELRAGGGVGGGHQQQQMMMPAIPETRVAAHRELEQLNHHHRHHHPMYPADTSGEGDGEADGGGGGAGALAKRTMAALHQHTWEQRIAIVSTLMTLLFVSLHSDSIARKLLPAQLFRDNSLVPWYIIVLKDCGIFCHMSACSLIHFALCDISLIYAFESMELGTKTGPKVKEFYREKVHVVVAAISGGIVALSICKALLLAWFRMIRDLLETAMILLSLGKDAFVSTVQAIAYISTSIINGLLDFVHMITTTPPSQWITSVVSGLARIITGICIWFLAVVIPFDGDDRPLLERIVKLATENITSTATTNYFYATTTTTTTEPTSMTTTILNAFSATTSSSSTVPDSQTIHQGQQQELGIDGDSTNLLTNETSGMNVSLNEATPSLAGSTTTAASTAIEPPPPITWREDAFETCQWLLSHSAFFLITFLVAMHFLTSSYRHKIRNNGDGQGTVGALAASSSNFPDDQSSIQTSPSLALQDETALVRNTSSTDTSMETQSTNHHHTNGDNRPTSITVKYCTESVTSRY